MEVGDNFSIVRYYKDDLLKTSMSPYLDAYANRKIISYVCVHHGRLIGCIIATDSNPCDILLLASLKCYNRLGISLKLINKLIELYDNINACMSINDTLYTSDLKTCGFEITNTTSSHRTMSRVV